MDRIHFSNGEFVWDCPFEQVAAVISSQDAESVAAADIAEWIGEPFS